MAHEAHAQGHADNNSIFKIAVNLAITCFISGLIIASTFAITKDSAEAQREKAKTDAMHALVKDADTFEELPKIEGETDSWFAAKKGGTVIAYVVPAKGKGYGGEIQMLAAVTPDGKAIDYKILKHAETPGLGDKAKDDKFRSQFKGKAPQDLEVVKVPTEKNIQALTGATITSRAVTNGIKEALEKVAAYSASQQK